MSGDYSRHRFNPRNNYSGVNMQQGRVQLDADWNEWADVIDRRTRAETIDTFGVSAMTGIGGVAVVSPQTPEAFFIQPAAGTFTIGPGRIYVDGLLAENFGDGEGEQGFDPVLAELYGLDPLDYTEQPYHPAPVVLPEGGPHLVYLEVWRREVTHLQERDLVEIAVGVDTTTRSQTVWQVRLLEDVPSTASCTSPDGAIPAWETLISPSAGRLSSRDVGVSESNDPCDLPPSGGYRGLENQLYRIEIHKAGDSSTATFKWSRDNASVMAEVVEIVSDTELRLNSLGRDEILRFSDGDWVEVVDNWRELSGGGGDPAKRIGVLRKIVVDEKKTTISFSKALPADMMPAEVGDDTLEKRHFRVIRWDQKGEIRDADNNVHFDLDGSTSTGAIPIPTAGEWLHLENGVQVQFSLNSATGIFRCNDYWTIAARTNDTSVEILDKAPPRGIHRHYARLSLITFPDSETDCRDHWPPESGSGCCRIIVEPGDNIQQAIDSLPQEGGCVCLRSGTHIITSPLQIMSPRILLCGEGPGVIVRSNVTLGALLRIGGSGIRAEEIEVRDIIFETREPTKPGYIIFLDLCSNVLIHRCTLMVSGEKVGNYLGIGLERCSSITLKENRFLDLFMGIHAAYFRDTLTITDNYLQGPSEANNTSISESIFHGMQILDSLGAIGINIIGGSTEGSRVEKNIIVHYQIGIFISKVRGVFDIRENHISRSGGSRDASFPTNSRELKNYLDNCIYAIHSEVPGVNIEGNSIDFNSIKWGGIRCFGQYSTIKDNIILARVVPNDKMLVPAGIFCCADQERGLAADYSVICNNTLVGVQSGIHLSGINGGIVDANQIHGSDNGWFGAQLDGCLDGVIRDNDIRGVYFGISLTGGLANRVAGNRVNEAGIGLLSFNENYIEASSNTISSCPLFGIILFIHNNGFLIENKVVNCSYFNPLNFCLGIGIVAEYRFNFSEALVRIEGCEVLNTGVSPDAQQITKEDAIGISGLVPACRVSHNRTGYVPPTALDLEGEHRALLLWGPLDMKSIVTHEAGFALLFGSATVSENKFTGPGFSSLVQFMTTAQNHKHRYRFRDVTFANNICEHLSDNQNETSATVMLEGGSQIVSGNHVTALPGVFSIHLGNNPTTLMGNITTGDYLEHGRVVPTPINQFNIRV